VNGVEIICLDLEGVLVPEIWINVAQHTGIEALKATTRDVPDYDTLMRQRLGILDAHGLTLADIQGVSEAMGPLDGAREFLDGLRKCYQVVILSDTFYEFAEPLMRQLDWPTLFCHRLKVDGGSRVVDYVLRMPDHKAAAVKAFKGLNFKVLAAGDSYNDTAMLTEADTGILFRAPDKVIHEFPEFPVAWDYGELRQQFARAAPALEAAVHESPQSVSGVS
jgi:phosphoserine/homoserine phosphotransferase